MGRRRGFGDALVERSGAGGDDIVLRMDVAEAARAEADRHTRQAAVAHDQIGTDANHMDRPFARQMFKEIGEIILVRRA